jgi:cyclophilin family peptidyl-prolyl cis-trans isomerase
MDGKNVVFGRVIEGYHCVQKIEEQCKGERERAEVPATVCHAGVYTL